MDPERWGRIEALYHSALEVGSSERHAYVAEHCNGDSELRREVESLLKQDRARALLDGSVSQTAAALFDADAELSPGTQLGPYRIEAELGSGGMGRVYRARDTRLGRSVAVKISRVEFSERFEREARIVAALNDSHICQIYDVGPNYLVMELVDGSPVKGPMPVAKAVEHAGQILAALDAAHRKGVVRRDLKPANILLTKQGVKLLDFGLAKHTPPVVSGDATRTQGLTGAGTILGTLQYMSPEQLQGKPVDSRSDLFSFGCVLYEMLTGKRAFEGENPASVMGAILEREPKPLEISPPLDRVVKRCLAKDPDQRFQTAGDLRTALEWALEQAPLEKVTKRRWIAASGVLALLVAVLSGALWFDLRKQAPEPPGYSYTISPVEGPPGYFGGAGFSISPDGRMIAVHAVDSHGQGSLMIRRLNSLEWRRMVSLEFTGRVSWSPDGTEIAFISRTKVKKLNVATGAVQTLGDLDSGGPPFTGWSSTGMIVFSRRGGLWRVPSSGGEPVQLTAADETRQESSHHICQFLPDGKHFLYLVSSRLRANSGIFVGSVDGRSDDNRRFVLSSTSSVVYAPGPRGSGYLLFEREGALVAQRFDTTGYRLGGEPFMLLPKIEIAGSFPTVSVSENGVMAYMTEHGSFLHVQLAWFNRKGEHLADVGPQGRYASFFLSPDGNRIALNRVDRDDSNAWILDLRRGGAFTKLTFESGGTPVWSPDGRRIAFVNRRDGAIVYEKKADGTGGEQRVGGPVGFLTDWAPDGTLLGESAGALWMLKNGKEVKPQSPNEASRRQSRVSPDGKWIAYTSDESKRQEEVYVQSFPAAGAKYQISTEGGTQPRWRRDGRELFYIAGNGKLMAVPVQTGASFEYGAATALFQPPVPEGPATAGYEVSADGQNFLMRTIPSGAPMPPITIVTNWLAAVKQ